MADLTTDAVAKVLGVLATAIKDETALLGALPRNMQFIKDEMDSMNGFLLHLTKTETAHDDQVRAWMKQIRDVAYIGEDCVDRYVRDVVPHEPEPHNGCGLGLPYVGDLKFFLCHPKKYCLRRRLAKQIVELRTRVNDVGDRRQRYGVTVPSLTPELARRQQEVEKVADDAQEETRKDAFRRALLLRQVGSSASSLLGLGWVKAKARQLLADNTQPLFVREAIGKLPVHVRSQGATIVRDIWMKCSPPDDETFRCIEMLLCALYACPYKLDSNVELEMFRRKLKDGAAGAEEIKRQAMVFCYSLLSTSQKSCLQYLTAFLEEKAISRTSLVRRWAAEGLVGREQGRTPEEELVFRGFINPARSSDAGTVKSCHPLAGSVRTFIIHIAGRDNFVADLPVHLDRQIRIRQIVLRTQTMTTRDDAAAGKPMDELVAFLGGLPEMYRLNVLDLGGCRGLKQRHIKAICTVSWLKYLCLRNTDISRLKPSLLKGRLTMLETLDIRQTNIRPGDIKSIFLPKLKHLLAGRYLTKGGDDAGTASASASASDEVELATVEMPLKIGRMRNMETLSHVQVSRDGKELEGVARLHKLRKLGVVVHGNERTATQLHEVIYALAGCLRSLSVWVTHHNQQGASLDISFQEEATPILILENLDIRGRCKLPSWIERATKLANVSLRDTGMNAQETLRRLCHVPSLSCLTLDRRSFVGQVLSFMEEVRFEALRFLIFDGDTTGRLAFEANAAPKLEKIVCNVGSVVHGGDLIVGIQHLPKLEVIELRGNFNLTRLRELMNGATTATNASKPTRYLCRYLDSGENEFVEIPKTGTDTTFSLPVGGTNQQNVF
ncbi:hypothetical protein HU200_000548 [Digitaria exilis]|uniref:Rx N-terminal domain-containing protein n=1 Tax=Digitaria exilis TaxID=1010633 RepID=A0A835KVJ5_9POAL|nr:hypothetical protein HU200_000548 [Digitaria exilis]